MVDNVTIVGAWTVVWNAKCDKNIRFKYYVLRPITNTKIDSEIDFEID